MGRLATHLAAKVAHADHLESLPNVSILDALLPRSLSSTGSRRRDPLEPDAPAKPTITHQETKRDKNGRLIMVRYKSRATIGAVHDALTAGNAAGERNKTKEVDGGAKNSGGDSKDAPEKEDGGSAWTPEEDAQLSEMKADGKTWAEIAQALGKANKGVPKARWSEIKKDGGDQKRNDEKGGQRGNEEEKKDEAKDGDFTADEDVQMKELLASNTSYKKIATALGRPLDKTLKDHVTKLKEEAKSASSNDETNDAKDNAGDKKKKDEPPKEETKKGKDKNKKDKQDDNVANANLKRWEDKAAKKKEEDSKPASAKAPSIAPSHHSSSSRRGEMNISIRDWQKFNEDEMFSWAEFLLLSELVIEDNRMGRGWLWVASRFYDKTGRRVHPMDIKEKFEEIDYFMDK